MSQKINPTFDLDQVFATGRPIPLLKAWVVEAIFLSVEESSSLRPL
jgi:hypothetical protein